MDALPASSGESRCSRLSSCSDAHLAREPWEAPRRRGWAESLGWGSRQLEGVPLYRAWPVHVGWGCASRMIATERKASVLAPA
ncbi:hypothetical protein NDU88_008770 [Pleurodeles waltl]|uniref:Uncharacterized protein n=1 Tax=Pleurodeles waltl TaxID=8319 RepID=A0AAV7RVM2_PLEWA|nr:hypothetical protein NDU88_008770 [Pleurodeles waltl]